jgi:hypothetical protein
MRPLILHGDLLFLAVIIFRKIIESIKIIGEYNNKLNAIFLCVLNGTQIDLFIVEYGQIKWEIQSRVDG